jgi:hypothetical protein
MADLTNNPVLLSIGHAISNGINFSRFEVLTDFVAEPTVPMPLVSVDVLTARRQKFQLKGLRAQCYLPICKDALGNIITYQTCICGLYHTYEFQLLINSSRISWSVAFAQNVDNLYNNNFFAIEDTDINTLSAKVTRKVIDPVWQGAGINVQLSLTMEGFTYQDQAGLYLPSIIPVALPQSGTTI